MIRVHSPSSPPYYLIYPIISSSFKTVGGNNSTLTVPWVHLVTILVTICYWNGLIIRSSDGFYMVAEMNLDEFVLSAVYS